ncbi:MAG: hypothetical protein IT257_01505 [Chitinophagaceae bacterium]|nr:hypothetical protein [Chitinophagaceae bacterium]
MKRLLSISFLFLYLLSSAGVTVTAHYCGGDLASLSLFKRISCCCDENQEAKEEGCCKNENKQLKITADQNKFEFAEKKFQMTCSILPSYGVFASFAVPNIKSVALSPVTLPRSPDNCCSIPLYKRNHSLLFYC